MIFHIMAMLAVLHPSETSRNPRAINVTDESTEPNMKVFRSDMMKFVNTGTIQFEKLKSFTGMADPKMTVESEGNSVAIKKVSMLKEGKQDFEEVPNFDTAFSVRSAVMFRILIEGKGLIHVRLVIKLNLTTEIASVIIQEFN